MAGSTFRTSGFRELENALLQISTEASRAIGRKALRKAGKPIHDTYKAKTKVKSGTLLDNENMGTRLNRRQRRIAGKPGPSEIELHIGTADPAGIQEEFGQRQAANPSLTPAWDQHGGTVALGVIGKELGAGIERRAKRAKRGK